MAPDAAYHFLPREEEDISQLKAHSEKTRGEKEEKEYDITCFQVQHSDTL